MTKWLPTDSLVRSVSETMPSLNSTHMRIPWRGTATVCSLSKARKCYYALTILQPSISTQASPMGPGSPPSHAFSATPAVAPLAPLALLAPLAASAPPPAAAPPITWRPGVRPQRRGHDVPGAANSRRPRIRGPSLGNFTRSGFGGGQGT